MPSRFLPLREYWRESGVIFTIKYYNMKRINLKSLELLGCDYKRGTEVYLNPANGDIFIRKADLISSPATTKGGKKYNRIDLTNSVVFKVETGERYEDAAPVLSRDN